MQPGQSFGDAPERLAPELGQRRPPPEIERFDECVLAQQVLEAEYVDIRPVCRQTVTRGPVRDQPRHPERRPHPRHMRLQTVAGRRRRPFRPERVNERRHPDRPPGMQREQSQHDPLTASGHDDRPGSAADFERPQHPNEHPPNIRRPTA
ncbi:hypothetical protein [Actinoplanes solisilvae]|uniref:hypothetical protein n=1 Tax=Actinoplanes solisilvae TaxID=2486853 RepID=UPI001F0BC682|nr:hypothetical protein [Actinoplanes solisilvae]